MILFSAPTCDKCKEIKEGFDLRSLGVEVMELTEDNAEALAQLAFYSLVKKAEEGLPILVLKEKEIAIRGAENIKKFLENKLKN